MEDIWERIIQNQETVRYRQADLFSPYYETVMNSIKHKSDGTDLITMNTFYRYEDIFFYLFSRNDIEKKVRDWLLDCMMHLLTRLELRNGVSTQEYALREKWHEIELNKYGRKLGRLFSRMSDEKKYLASHFMLQQERNGESVSLFAKALIQILQDGVVYKSEVRPKELLLYMGKKENEQNLNEIEFAKEAYMPFGYTLRVFWEYSFGIVEMNSCLQNGKIEIY